MSRKAQASALGAVFLTIVFVLAAVVLVQYIRSQTELQAIASQIQTQRAGEGALTLSINDTYATPPVRGNNSPVLLRVNVLNGTRVSTGTLDSQDGKGLLLIPENVPGGYLLRVNVSVSVPPNTVNLTQSLNFTSSATVRLEVYTRTPSGSYALYTVYILPAGITSSIQVASTNYILSVQHPGNFTLLLDAIRTSLMLYNTTGFYLRVKNEGPGYTTIHNLWVVTQTAATRTPLNVQLPPGDTTQISVPINSSEVREVRVSAVTRVYILRPTPPTTLSRLAAVNQTQPGVTNQPLFRIVSYNTTIAGTVGSKARLAVTISNTGSLAGTAQVEVYDQTNTLVNATQATINPAATQTVSLTITLPSTRGTYTWAIKVKNLATGNYDDTKTFLVVAKDIYLLSPANWQVYQGFETPPNWDVIGGTVSIVPGGFSGNAVQLNDKKGGIGKGAQYYNTTNIASTFSSLWLYVKVKITANEFTYAGLALIDSTETKAYYASIGSSSSSTTASAYILYAGGRGENWNTLAQSSAWGFDPNGWYTVVLNYAVTQSAVNLNAWFYNPNGNVVASLTASDTSGSRFTPAYIGVGIEGQTSLFDVFVASTTDPRYVIVKGLQQGWRVRLLDSTGRDIVPPATADSSGTASLLVVINPLMQNVTIQILDQNGNLVAQKTFSTVRGGDVYAYG